MLPGIRPGAVFLLVPGVRLARLLSFDTVNVRDIFYIAKVFLEKNQEKTKKFASGKKIRQNTIK